MLTRALLTAALAALLITLAACGGGGGSKPTATKAATRTATKQVTRTPATGTPVATETPPASSTAGPPAQPSEAPSPTEPPAAQPTDTPPPGVQTTIRVSLREFSLGLSTGTAPAGRVTFDAQNNGTIQHNFLVIKTGLADGALPVDQTSLTVDTSHLDVLNQPSLIDTEDSQQVALNLASGHYVLICNVVDHYLTGMHVSFTVQ